MLGACAIMKYSADFWFDKSDDKQGVFKKIWRDTKAFFSSGCHDGYEFSIPCAIDAASAASATSEDKMDK